MRSIRSTHALTTIPPSARRKHPPAYDNKASNCIKRLFCKLKGYRAVTMRYDKLASVFLGGVLAALPAVSPKCIVNTT